MTFKSNVGLSPTIYMYVHKHVTASGNIVKAVKFSLYILKIIWKNTNVT